MTDPLPDDDELRLDRTGLVDELRSSCLCSAGNQDYVACTVINPDGSIDYVLALGEALDDPTARYSRQPPPHEDVGELPLAILRKVVETTRRHRVVGTEPEEEIA